MKTPMFKSPRFKFHKDNDFFKIVEQRRRLETQINKEDFIIIDLKNKKSRTRSNSEQKRLQDEIKMHTEIKHICFLNLNKIISVTPNMKTQKKTLFFERKSRKSVPIRFNFINYFSRLIRNLRKK